MKRILLISISVIVLILVSFLGFRHYTKSFSPEAMAEFHKNDLDITVKYSQPVKKGRYIFGRQEDNALVPYGKVWRTGANEATTLVFGSNVLFAGEKLPAGSYTLWSMPGQAGWKLIVNSEIGQWGTDYNDGKDYFRVDVPIRVIPTVQESFNIYFEETPNGANMILSWDQIEAIVPIVHQ